MRGLTALLLSVAALPAGAVSLDLSAEYRLRALSYSGLALDPDREEAQTFFSERARIGIVVKRIPLGTLGAVETQLEVGLVLQALGVAGSTSPASVPLDRIAARYPATGLTPWVENAYLKVTNALAMPLDLTVGRQPARVGGGLVLSDDHLGFTGLTAKARPGKTACTGFFFQPKALSSKATDKVQVGGLAAEFPLAGTLDAYLVAENDLADPSDNGVPLASATRLFPGARYLLRTPEFAFEGEAALQRGRARLAGSGRRVDYKGQAGQVTALWKQGLGRFGEGTARVSAGEASGDNPATAADEAFFPSFGHRFDGLERDGFGDFFGASLYDAIGPSTATQNGLPAGASGLRVARIGLTPPNLVGLTLDLDYYLFQAARASGGASRALGNEFDLRLSHRIQDRVLIRLSGAFFRADHGIRPRGARSASGQRFLLEVSASF